MKHLLWKPESIYVMRRRWREWRWSWHRIDIFSILSEEQEILIPEMQSKYFNIGDLPILHSHYITSFTTNFYWQGLGGWRDRHKKDSVWRKLWIIKSWELAAWQSNIKVTKHPYRVLYCHKIFRRTSLLDIHS